VKLVAKAGRDTSSCGERNHHTCPGGHDCTLAACMEHELHICKNPDCKCHSRERYEDTKR
jgi:hypothetical protein